MRIVVIANPSATSTTARQIQSVRRALSRDNDVELAETSHRGHAAALACRAMRARVDAVVALGGDGTLNEIVNGLLTDGVHPGVPGLGIVPAGSTNVFARALGLPNDPTQAVAILLEALEQGRRRPVTVGQADERYFLFTAGFGFSAAVVGGVERARRRGRRSTPWLYVRTAVGEYGRALRSRPVIRIEYDNGDTTANLHLVIVTNTSVWTYLGRHAVTTDPRAALDSGLSVYGRRRINPVSMSRALGELLAARRTPSAAGGVTARDVSVMTLRAARPAPFEVDGDYLGTRSAVRCRAVPAALTMIM